MAQADEQRGQLRTLALREGQELWWVRHQASQSQGHAHAGHPRHLGVKKFAYFQEEINFLPAKRKVIRGIGGDPEGSSLAIPSIAREGGDLPPTPPTTGKNSLRIVKVKLVAQMFWTHLLASRSSPQPRLSPCWGPILRFSCRSPSMPWRYHMNKRSVG